MISIKRRVLSLLLATFLLFALAGCSALSPKEPVELSFWHVYGEQADSPMNLLVQEFNQTVGYEEGVRVKVTGMSSAAKIGDFLLEAQSGGQRAHEMPDLFSGHLSNALAMGEENIVDWRDWLTEQELSDFVPGFLADGTAEDGALLVFPVSKSTHVLMLNGSGFARFFGDTGVTYNDLTTWEDFYDAAGKFYAWSGGTPFCAMDYPLRAVELDAIAHGAKDFYTADGWYDFDNTLLKESWMKFARALVQRHVVVSDLYSNTQVMTGEVLSGLGSSAAILYYNDTVSYEDGRTEPMDLHVLPMPRAEGRDPLMTQAGVGLCAYKSTEEKAKAASLFARWLTEKQRNLDFVVQTGYMPVHSGAFDEIGSYTDFPEPAADYRSLYKALHTMCSGYTPVSEPNFEDYYTRVSVLYNGLRQFQQELPARIAAGEDMDTLAAETWTFFQAIV